MKLSIFVVAMLLWLDFIVALQYNDDEPLPWYVELSWQVFPLLALTLLFLLAVAAMQRGRR